MSSQALLNNRYQIEGRIGSGGMADVYRARDLTLERTVAIKLLRDDFSKDPAFRERFRQEAKAAANLSHPNIVTVHDFGFDETQIFIVMEYIPGTDLKTILESRGKLPIDEALNLIIQACAGIGYAHRAGLIHCDVKPHNMIVTPDQRLKVTDFGIARALASIHPQETSNVIWGSPQYFSPETASGRPPSPASDVYGLGVVLYEMLTGRLPFIANNAAELSRMHRSETPTPPSQLNPLIPLALEQICLKVLSKEPSARYRTADQFGRVLISLRQSIKLPPMEAGVTVRSPLSETIQSGKPIGATPPQKQPAYQVPTQQNRSVSPSPVPSKSTYTPPAVIPATKNALDIDWGTWGLVFLLVITVGGLIPFWVWIYLLYNPPGR
ncbi:MAG TPA: protein kinase [Anaerolineales bacterium]|nr:protein kinase [Anaerolineales bacterium]